MQDLSREAILRMVGLHDAAYLSRQLNAIQLSLEEESGKMVTYWTEIRKTEKEVTLIAGRMDDAETDIAQLQVTAGQISASVSSLQTTVNGHTTSIGQLTIKTDSISQSVSSLTTTVNGHTSQISTLRTDLNGISATVTADHTTLGTHTTQIGSLQVTTNSISQEVSNISDEVDAVSGTVTTHTSQISTLRTDLNGISATVTSDHTTLGTHTTQIGSLQVTTNSISGRVTAIEGDYVKEAEISLMVKKDGNGYISNASIKADRIDFTFTHSTNFISGGQTVMNIDNSGNLWIAGEYKGGSITGNITVGTGTKKMYIEPTSSGARLVGKSGDTETLSLGFYDGTSSHNAQLRFNSSYYSEQALQVRGTGTGSLGTIDVDANGLSGPAIHIAYNGSSGLVRFIFQSADKYVILRATDYGYSNSRWPTEGVDNISALGAGTVYLRSDGCLGVKQ